MDTAQSSDNGALPKRIFTSSNFVLVATIASAVFTGFSALFAGGQIYVAREQAREATRAYLGPISKSGPNDIFDIYCASCKFRNSKPDNSAERQNRIEFYVHNYGQTLASSVIVSYNIQSTYPGNVLDIPEVESFVESQEKLNQKQYVGEIFQSQEEMTRGFMVPFEMQKLEMAYNLTSTVYIYGFIYYKDIYGQNHRNHFLYRVYKDGDFVKFLTIGSLEMDNKMKDY